ncbi:iron-sulfur cluster repair di-iron protein [Halosimplex sp. J119]
MTEIDPERTLASIVEDAPGTARAFESLGLDYCCGGDRTLVDACDEAGLAVEAVRDRLAEAGDRFEADCHEWDGLADLADHVVETHHDYLREELPALEELVAKVARVHRENHPELSEVESVFRELAAEMREHIDEEESELFPLVRRLDRGESLSTAEADRLREEVRTFEDDHAATADRLDEIADLTDDYAAPDDACASYRSMLDRLERLEHDTHMHVHEENNVLFAEAEDRLPAAATG